MEQEFKEDRLGILVNSARMLFHMSRNAPHFPFRKTGYNLSL